MYVQHYLSNNHRSSFDESLTSLCLAKLTKNRFWLVPLPTATSTHCVDCRDLTSVPPAINILLRCSGFKKKERKSAPFTLHHSTDTDELRTDDLDSNWLNTRKGKLRADKTSSKGISLSLSQFSGVSTSPDLQSILNLQLFLSTIIRELSVKEQISIRTGYQPEETIQLIVSCA